MRSVLTAAERCTRTKRFGSRRCSRCARLDRYEVRPRADVEADVDARGLDPVHFLDADERDAAGALEHEPLEDSPAGSMPARSSSGRRPAGRSPAPRDRRNWQARRSARLEALIAVRLEQVIEGVRLEGLDGVAVVGGDEHRHRRCSGSSAAARRSRPGPASGCRGTSARARARAQVDRLAAVARLARDLDVRLAASSSASRRRAGFSSSTIRVRMRSMRE